MALATRCPHCGTTFRVAQDQLKLRAGVVRCGTCKQIFNGIESLVAPDAPGQGAGAKPVPETPWRTAPGRAPAEPAPVPAMGPRPLTMPPVPAAKNTQDAPQARDTVAPAPVERPTLPHPPATPGQQAAPAGDAMSAPSDRMADSALELDFDIDDDDGSAEQARLHAPPGDDAAHVENHMAGDGAAHVDDHVPGDDGAPVEGHVAGGASSFEDPLPAGDGAAPFEEHLNAGDRAAPADDVAPSAGDDDYTVELAGPPGRGGKRAAERGRLRQQRLHAEADAAAAPAASERAEPEPELADDEVPDFVLRARRKSRGALLRRRLMLAGTPLLALLLAGQGLYLFRDRLAASFPQAKPTLVRACAALGCRVGFPAQIDMVSLEAQELQTLPSGSLVLASVLRNRSALVQAWPHLELTLTDSADKPLARRVFRPEDYLADRAELGKGLAPRSETPVKVYLDASLVKASGYRVYIFYP